MRRETGLREPVCLIRRWAVRTCSAIVYDDFMVRASLSLSLVCLCCRKIISATCKYVRVEQYYTCGIDLAGD